MQHCSCLRSGQPSRLHVSGRVDRKWSWSAYELRAEEQRLHHPVPRAWSRSYFGFQEAGLRRHAVRRDAELVRPCGGGSEQKDRGKGSLVEAMGMERKLEQEVYEEIKIEPSVVAPLGDQDVEVAGRAGHGEQHGEPEDQDSDEGSDPDLDEPPEAADAVRRRVDPLPSVEEERLHRVTHMPYRSCSALQPQPMTIHTGEYPDQRQYDYQFLKSTGAISSRATSMTGTWFSWAERRRRR